MDIVIVNGAYNDNYRGTYIAFVIHGNVINSEEIYLSICATFPLSGEPPI